MTFAGSALRRGRAHAESLMIDTFTVSRIDETVPPDPLTGDPQWVQVYSGPGKLQAYSPYEQTPVVGEHALVTQRYLVHFPMDAFDPHVDDVVEVQSAVFDSTLTGRRFRITAPFHKSFLTARRMFAEEVLA